MKAAIYCRTSTEGQKEEKTILAQKMELLLNDEKRQQMSREALRTGLSYSEEKNHQEMIGILREVAAQKASAPNMIGRHDNLI